jgi:hypothetical protein
MIKDVATNEQGLRKYRCPFTWCFGGGRPVLRSTIRAHIRRYGRDHSHTKPILVCNNAPIHCKELICARPNVVIGV